MSLSSLIILVTLCSYVSCLPCNKRMTGVIDFRPDVEMDSSFTVLPTLDIEADLSSCGEFNTVETEPIKLVISDAIDAAGKLSREILNVFEKESHFKKYLLFSNSSLCPEEMMLKEDANFSAAMSILVQYVIQYNVHMRSSTSCEYTVSPNMMSKEDYSFEQMQKIILEGLLCAGVQAGWESTPSSLEGTIEVQECMDRDHQIVNLLYCLASDFLPALKDFVETKL